MDISQSIEQYFPISLGRGALSHSKYICAAQNKIRMYEDKRLDHKYVGLEIRKCLSRLARVTIVAVKKYGIVRQATDDNIIQCVPFACCITKATDTYTEYIIRVAFPQQ
jgi:hypothetical protein